MSEEIKDLEALDTDVLRNSTEKAWLPKAIGCMILGIMSIIGGFQYGIPGIVCGIIALSYYSKDKPLYNSDPIKYAKPYKYLRAGKITAIIGLVFSTLMTILFIWLFTTLSNNSYSRYDDYYYDDYNFNDYQDFEDFEDWDY